MNYQRLIENKFKRLFTSKRKQQSFLITCFLINLFIFDLSIAESNNSNFQKIDNTDIKYLESKKELEDYIIDTGDHLFIEFYPANQLSDEHIVSPEGEIILPRLDETFVRGLTTSELEVLLENRYLEFLIEPKIKVRIVKFKPSRVLVRGEVQYPGLYKFQAYQTNFSLSKKRGIKNYFEINQSKQINNGNSLVGENNMESIKQSTQNNNNINIKRNTENITTISNVIKAAGGVTTLSDLSKIELIRDIPIGKGGGKKKR